MRKAQYVQALMEANDDVIAEFVGKDIQDVSYHASQGTLGEIIETAYDASTKKEREEFEAKHFAAERDDKRHVKEQ